MLVFDLETNGLLNDATQIHCVAIYDTETDETTVYNDECPGQGMSNPVHRALQHLETSDCIVGHNILSFDIPVIRNIYSWFNPPDNCVDTLLLSRLYHPNMMAIDQKHRWQNMPLQLYGRHSLESYGYRLGEYKGNFSKTTDWKEWSQEMEDYCVQDVQVTKKLCEHFHPYLNGSR